MTATTAPDPASETETDPTPSSSDRRSRLWQALGLVLCLAGFALAMHLLHRGTQLRSDQVLGTIDPCVKVFGRSCDDTLRSAHSSVLGLSLSGWGMVYFAGVGTLLTLSLVQGSAFRREALLAGALMSLVGAAVAVGLASLMALRTVPVCPSCLVIHGVCLALVVSIKKALAEPWGNVARALVGGLKYVCGARTDSPVESTWKSVGFLNVVLVMAMTFLWSQTTETIAVSTANVRAVPDSKRKEVITHFVRTPAIEIPVDPDDPQLGTPDARARFIVFSSFRCKGCQAFAKALESIRENYGQSISVVFKYHDFQGEECPDDVHEAQAKPSCRANWAAEAARRQGKFWEFHDALFRAGFDCEEASLIAAAKVAELDMARFDADRRSEDVRARVKRTVDQGNEWGVPVTPDVYLNGKRIEQLGFFQLQWLVEHELAPPSATTQPNESSSSAVESVK